MNESNEKTQQLIAPASEHIKEIDVPCTVEIGDLHMAVSDVASLIPGQIIELNQPVSNVVHLKAGNRLLCSGRLVEVSGELALEITEVP